MQVVWKPTQKVCEAGNPIRHQWVCIGFNHLDAVKSQWAVCIWEKYFEIVFLKCLWMKLIWRIFFCQKMH